MYTIICAYKVSLEKRAAFEAVYAEDGAWVKLFKKGNGYLGTRLMHSDDLPENYVTIDHWDTEENYETFMTQWKDAYQALDRECEGLAFEETCLGKFGKGFS